MKSREKIGTKTTRKRLTRQALEQATKEELIDLVLALFARVEELERRLGMNSSNSSKPPSTDSPQTKKNSRKKKSKRKRGGQPGHEGHNRDLVPVDQVDNLNIIKPCTCERCSGINLEFDDSSPWRHQVWDIPEIRPFISEWQMVDAICLDCGHITHAKLPDGIPTGNFGTRTQSMVSLLSGVYHQSKRFIQSFMADIFGLDISLGSVPACEKKVSKAIQDPVQEAHTYAQDEEVMHADETGWRQGNKKAWLWVAVTSAVTVFMIHLSRGREAAQQLLGGFKGILVTDRWGPYRVHNGLRQFCWAHLLRSFVGFSELRGKAGKIGKQLVDKTDLMFKWWHRIRDGTMSRSTFKRRMIDLRIEVEDLLVEGEICGQSPMAGVCKRILSEAQHLWTFVDHEGVEPTNNTSERKVRQGVLWRKICFGTQSEEGSRFVERIMTVAATCRQQDRNVVEFVNEAC